MFESIFNHEALFIGVAVASLAIFLVTMAAIPYAATLIPADYFLGQKRPLRSVGGNRRSLLWVVARIIKNIAGVVLILAGIAMLVTPGQGLLTIMAGFMLVEFPGKFRLERWIVCHTPVLRLLNRFRRQRGRKPIILDGEG